MKKKSKAAKKSVADTLIQVRIPARDARRLKRLAKKSGLSRTGFARSLLIAAR